MIAVRDAAVDDLPAIAAIYAHHVLTGTATFEIDPPDLAEVTVRWRRGVDQGWPWLVAADGRGVAGYGYTGPYNLRAAYARTAETTIYLAPDRLRQGIGRILLTALIERTAAAGFEQLVAAIGDSGNAASIGLHAACGFRHAGCLEAVGRKFGRSLDVVYMQRAAGTGSSS